MACLWNDTGLIAELGSSFTCVYKYTNPLMSHFTFCQPAKPFSLIAPQAYVAFILPCQYTVLFALRSETGSWWHMCVGSTGGQSDVELCQATAGSGSQHLSGGSMSTQQCQLSPPNYHTLMSAGSQGMSEIWCWRDWAFQKNIWDCWQSQGYTNRHG